MKTALVVKARKKQVVPVVKKKKKQKVVKQAQEQLELQAEVEAELDIQALESPQQQQRHMTDSELDLLSDSERTAAIDARVAAYEEDEDQQREVMPLAKRELASVRYISKWRLMLSGKEAGFRTIDRVNGLDINVW